MKEDRNKIFIDSPRLDRDFSDEPPRFDDLSDDMMNLPEAYELARQIKDMLEPWCERIEVAGSIRRKKPKDIKDVEIVCIPRTVEAGLFGDQRQRHPGFVSAVESMRKIKGDANAGKYTQRIHPDQPVKVDIFMVEPSNWGLQLLIRTGPAEYGQRILTKFNRWGYKSKEGYPVHQKTNEKLEFREEEKVFNFLQIDCIQPQDRK